MDLKALNILLDKKVAVYNQPFFISNDPISIPHQFSKKQDIEIAGFFAAILAWGNRKSIINSCQKLMQLMHHAPHDFCLNHADADLKTLLQFKHRTFNATDLLYCISFFKYHYQEYDSLEPAFLLGLKPKDANVEGALIAFHDYFFSLPDYPERSRKHIATPKRKSACKRLNMYLRWMVRQDKNGVDFGLWKNIKPRQLICPLDIHVHNIAKQLGLLPTNSKADWATALRLTKQLKKFNLIDPVRYDFALFSMGANEP